MEVRGIRTLALIAVAALAANAQSYAECYAKCATIACDSAQTPPRGCHHQKSSHEDTGCPQHHSEFAGSGMAKGNLAMAAPVLAVFTADSAEVSMQPLLPLQPNRGSPPGGGMRSTISVLRI